MGWGGAVLGDDLELSLDIEHGSYLQYEPIMAFLTVRNDSDTPFVVHENMEADASSIDFEIRPEGREALDRTGAAPVIKRVRIDPDGSREVFADLTMYYNLTGLRRYTVAARTRRAGRTYLSDRKSFEVVRGMELARAKRAIPDYPELVREYYLRYWLREGREHLFLSVDEPASGLNYGVFSLGRVVRLTPPVVKVDRRGEVVVVHQSGIRMHTRSVFLSNREGVRFIDQTYHLPDGKPFPQGGEKEKEPGEETREGEE